MRTKYDIAHSAYNKITLRVEKRNALKFSEVQNNITVKRIDYETTSCKDVCSETVRLSTKMDMYTTVQAIRLKNNLRY